MAEPQPRFTVVRTKLVDGAVPVFAVKDTRYKEILAVYIDSARNQADKLAALLNSDTELTMTGATLRQL